jgi:hypothetical protein
VDGIGYDTCGRKRYETRGDVSAMCDKEGLNVFGRVNVAQVEHRVPEDLLEEPDDLSMPHFDL